MSTKKIQPSPIISCQEATRLSSVAMERHLTVKENIDLQLHLMVCSLCVTFTKQIESLRLILRSYHPHAENKISTETKDRIKAALNTQSN